MVLKKVKDSYSQDAVNSLDRWLRLKRVHMEEDYLDYLSIYRKG